MLVPVRDMPKFVYDTDNDGKVDVAASADTVPWAGATVSPRVSTPAAHTHLTPEVTGLDAALGSKAPLAFSGADGHTHGADGSRWQQLDAAGDNSFRGGGGGGRRHRSPGAPDTLNELAAAPGNDANFSATVTNSLAGKLVKAFSEPVGSHGHCSNGRTFGWEPWPIGKD